MSYAVRQQFNIQQSEAIAAIDRWTNTKSYRSKDAAEDKRRKRDLLAALILWTVANTNLADAMQPILYALMIETGMDAFMQVGKQGSQFNPLDPAVVKSARAQADKASDTINQETNKQLRASLSQGIDQGEAPGQLITRIAAVMGVALTIRTARIAASESQRAMGNADVAAWMQTGTVTGKEWYTAKDERVCPFCDALDGTIIAIDGDFYTVGDTVIAGGKTLNIAYDDVEAPPLHVSCRCVVLDVDLA